MSAWRMTKEELAEITGYSYRQLYDINKGLSKENRLFVEGKDGKCDLAIFVQRWVKYKEDRAANLNEDQDVQLTKDTLSKAAGYTYRHLHNIDKGLQEDRKLFVSSGKGKCDLGMFIQRWVQYNVTAATEDGGQSLDDVKAVHEKVKTRKTELEVRRLEGELVSIHDVRKLWGDIATTVTQNMLHLPSTIAPMVTMMDSVEIISSIIDTEIRKVLNMIADTPEPDYAQAEDAEDIEGAEDEG